MSSWQFASVSQLFIMQKWKRVFLKYETSYFLIRLLNYLGICPFSVLSLGNWLEALYQCTILPSLWTDFTQFVFFFFLREKIKWDAFPKYWTSDTFSDLKSDGSVTCESSAYPCSTSPIQPLALRSLPQATHLIL